MSSSPSKDEPAAAPGASGRQQEAQQDPEGASASSSGGQPLSPPPPPEVNQEVTSSSAASYSGLAAKTVENIRRLQENVGAGSVSAPSPSMSTGVQQVSPAGAAASSWSGNHQVPPASSTNDNVQQPDALDLCPPSSSPLRSQQPPPQSPLPSISPTLASTFNALVTIDPCWQSGKRSVRERNAVMCNNAMMADVYFSVGADLCETPRKFPAHKYVLATGSTVFYAMFFGGLSEKDSGGPSKKDPSSSAIEVPDVEPPAFLAMLRYLYCDEVALDDDSVLATLYCAKRYIVPHLAEECVKFLEDRLNAKNAAVLLSQARLFEEPALMQRAWDVIDAQAQAALLSESFSDVDFDTLRAVLARETLNCRETVVFHAALRWSAAECGRRGIDAASPQNRREVLGPAMHQIRFPAMSVQEFADEVVKSDLLSLRETTDLFVNFTASRSAAKPSVLYPSRPRVGLRMQVCHRFQSSAYRSNQWRYRGRCDSIQFCVDHRIFVIGFGLYGSSSGSSDYTARIELKETGDGASATTVATASAAVGSGGGAGGGNSSSSSNSSSTSKNLAENAVQFHSDGSSNTFQVFFEHPVQAEPDVFYTASVVLDGAELSYFGQEGMPEVQAGAVTFQFQCSADSTNGTGVQGGQIPELLFYGPTPPPESATGTLKKANKNKSASRTSVSAPAEPSLSLATPTASENCQQ